MTHHKRKKPRNQRAGCKMCKPWKINGAGKWNRGEPNEKISDFKRRATKVEEQEEYENNKELNIMTRHTNRSEIEAGQNKVIESLQQRLIQKGTRTFDNPHEALGIITEEYFELVEAVRSNDLKRVEDELIDVAVAALFSIISLSDKSP